MTDTTDRAAPEPATASRTPRAGARRGRPGYDQDEIVRVATDLFTRHGYEATSIGMLASELGLTKSAIYHHVASKEALLRIPLDRALHALEQSLEAGRPPHVPDNATAGQRVEAVVRATALALIEELPSVTLLLRLRGNTPLEREAMERRRAFDREVTALVEACAADGELADGINPRIATRLLFGMINSITEWYRPGGPLDADAVADLVVAMAMHGLRGR
ncbi:TetR/AcrR family transcriptional regulator [Helcobacillus massiliensis]|uniref:TetR/AcrR family transcriptional regulator n=1 Tax=Helcobacillus massiliensis TaxID=521392 RepID=UPI00255289FD|nr:TetR/AcrR family transcriptional regulator [Helcobacillus massiliensis]MDK7741635.1 TetR/AcrR family transcriptional regulator [Helcobacillus massiliensis]WOO92679.1 TetR/AcrR family transcriptional regulator [Helcobacillus massiliensis]